MTDRDTLLQITKALEALNTRLVNIETDEDMRAHDGDPGGTISAASGTLCWDYTNQNLYINSSDPSPGTTWTQIAGLPASTGASSWGIPYEWDTGTADADPGSGELRFNHATYSSVTHIFANDVDTNGDNREGQLASFDDPDNTTKGLIFVTSGLSAGGWWVGEITAITDDGGYWDLTVSYLDHGGSFSAGEIVYLAYTPYGDGDPFSEANILEGPDVDLVTAAGDVTIGRGGDTILVFDSGGDPIAEYAATSAGLDSASAAASSGDVIWLPAATISGDHTLTAGVHYIGVSRWASILTGEITLGDGTTLECCTIERTDDSADDLKGVVGPAAGNAKMRNCDVDVSQAGAGNAYCLDHGGTGDVRIHNCWLEASAGGIARSVYRDGGNVYVIDSQAPINAPMSE